MSSLFFAYSCKSEVLDSFKWCCVIRIYTFQDVEIISKCGFYFGTVVLRNF